MQKPLLVLLTLTGWYCTRQLVPAPTPHQAEQGRCSDSLLAPLARTAAGTAYESIELRVPELHLTEQGRCGD